MYREIRIQDEIAQDRGKVSALKHIFVNNGAEPVSRIDFAIKRFFLSGKYS